MLERLFVASSTSQLILQSFGCFTYVTAHSPSLSLLLRHRLFTYVTWRTALLILHSSRHFTYVTAHFPTLPSLCVRHGSFSNPSVASPTSQLFLQPLFRYFYVTGSSLTLPGEPPCSFSKLPVTSPTSHLILQPFRRFTYVTAHSAILPLLHLLHSSFSNPSFASPKSQALHLRHLASHPWSVNVIESSS